jgi:hypothetical protein
MLVVQAAIRGDADIMTALIDCGAPLDGTPTYRPLIHALPYPGLVQLLLERGANPNVTDSSNRTILQRALELEASDEVIRILQKFGATQ